MSLPLLEEARAGHEFFRFAPIENPPALIPERKPEAGEQYRFHFDMTKCIGCKCCEVACNEQNGNPAEIKWRRVGEIEAGNFPFTQRLHLSMGCNHCLDAACLTGCPVDAYSKDNLSGLVLHSADACIGCQYCTWNCPYGVPQFNEERGVVGKCDMCHGRLEQGREPACVNACPQGAIAVEIVNIAEWRNTRAAEANAPGMPDAEATMSTTRITAPAQSQGEFRKGDYHRVRPEAPHWPLVVFLTATQAAWGVLSLEGNFILGAALLMLGLAASLAHLGRPIHAARAMKMWRRSWLSREVVLFAAYAAALPVLYLSRESALPIAFLGAGAIFASARIYMVPARPAWQSPRTLAAFSLTGIVFGAAAANLREVAYAAAATQALLEVSKLWVLHTANEFELRQSARLLTQDFRYLFLLRLALLASVLLPAPYSLLGIAASEAIGRYLFFVTVVPRNMAATFSNMERAA